MILEFDRRWASIIFWLARGGTDISDKYIDVIGSITYSKRFGFLDNGKDIGQIIQNLHSMGQHSTLIGIYAWLHPLTFSLFTKFKASGAGG